MLENTFIHLPTIGYKTEQSIWEKGIRTWDQFLDNYQDRPHFERFVLELFQSKVALHESNSRYFATTLPRQELWRAWPHFESRTVFLDIETTGLSPVSSEVTVVGLYDGKKVETFIQGKNLDELPGALLAYKSVITFNGALFDLPFLKTAFPSISFPHLHIDLRFVLGSLGYRGGLKYIEKTLGLERSSAVSMLTGLDAVRLWRKYKKGDLAALETLVEYNSADISNLKILMDLAYEKKKSSLGFK